MAYMIQKGCNRIRYAHNPYQLSYTRNLGYIYARQIGCLADGRINMDRADEYLISCTTKIPAYSNSGRLDLARQVFDEMAVRDCISCNVMIREYVRHGRICDARGLFDEMPERNTASWNTMIMAYASDRRLHIALKLFLVMPEEERDAVSWTTILSGLARDSRIADSWQLFRQLPKPDSTSWSSMISGCQQNGLATESLLLFKEMLSTGQRPVSHSITSAFAAAADLATLSNGQQLYSQFLKRGFDDNSLVLNSAISMFMKAGSLESAVNLFNSMSQSDKTSYNAMISGCGQHGRAVEAILLFHQMQKVGFHPDKISFLGVLLGCSRSGFVKEGMLYFDSMQKDFGVPREPEHYICLVDTFARAGFLKEATMMIMKMPFQPTAIFWRTLLNGCRIFGAFGLGMYAADQISELEPGNTATCLMVMEMYAAVGRWAEVARLRGQIREMDAKKQLSNSWIEIKGKVHLFTTRDETHRDSKSIYGILELLADATSEHV